jgi:hypothetical protein
MLKLRKDIAAVAVEHVHIGQNTAFQSRLAFNLSDAATRPMN